MIMLAEFLRPDRDRQGDYARIAERRQFMNELTREFSLEEIRIFPVDPDLFDKGPVYRVTVGYEKDYLGTFQFRDLDLVDKVSEQLFEKFGALDLQRPAMKGPGTLPPDHPLNFLP